MGSELSSKSTASNKKSYINRLGDNLLSHALRRSIISEIGFHYRVRDGIECITFSIVTKPINIAYELYKVTSLNMYKQHE